MEERRRDPSSGGVESKQSEALEAAWRTVEQLRARNAHLDPDEILAEVTAEVEAVRQELYEQRTAASKRRS